MKEFSLNDLNEDDIILLESLIKSPAFHLLKKVLGIYKGTVLSAFSSCDDSNKMFALQGRLAGLSVVENLPGLLVQQRQTKLDRAKQEADMKEKFKLQLPPSQPEFKKREAKNRPPKASQAV